MLLLWFFLFRYHQQKRISYTRVFTKEGFNLGRWEIFLLRKHCYHLLEFFYFVLLFFYVLVLLFGGDIFFGGSGVTAGCFICFFGWRILLKERDKGSRLSNVF